MAEVIRARKLRVVVDGACVSSCANYLFVAGLRQEVRPNSVVLWHGGVTREAIVEMASAVRAMVSSAGAPREAVAANVQRIEQEMGAAMTDQRRLYGAVGLDPGLVETLADWSGDAAPVDGATVEGQAFIFIDYAVLGCAGLGNLAHVPHPDHLGPALHQRRQAPGDAGGLDAAGRRLCAVPAEPGARDALYLRHRRARHADRAGGRRGGQDPATFCAEQHKIQHDLGRAFGLSWDHFGRSSSPQNHRLTQRFAQTLWEAGFLEERVTQQVYSNADKRFLPDRYVIGTCPHCGYEAARGDQCENCTRVLDPADLLQPRSAVSGSEDIEIRGSKHLFLRQSLFAAEAARMDREPSAGSGRCW
jgi:hypothetical protein